MNKQVSFLRKIPVEAALWGGGLVLLFLVDPASTRRLDLCLFHRLGLGPCPGCGLGASIHYFLRGDMAASWASHPLGIPAFLILAARTIGLLARPLTGGYRSLRSKGA